MTTKKTQPRGRPRNFDPVEAVATAQRLFHARGYDAVSVADVTSALGINPPSFYAAFGSKAELYSRVVCHYAAHHAIPLDELLLPGRPVADCLLAVLEDAARRYAADPAAAGCLVLEGTHCNDPAARTAARSAHAAGETMLRQYIGARYPGEADRLTDFVTTTLAGLSAQARSGHDLDRLMASARLAGKALKLALAD